MEKTKKDFIIGLVVLVIIIIIFSFILISTTERFGKVKDFCQERGYEDYAVHGDGEHSCRIIEEDGRIGNWQRYKDVRE